jgi:hypothetical protein
MGRVALLLPRLPSGEAMSDPLEDVAKRLLVKLGALRWEEDYELVLAALKDARQDGYVVGSRDGRISALDDERMELAALLMLTPTSLGPRHGVGWNDAIDCALNKIRQRIEELKP